MGRLEDAELKGVNLACAALGRINKDGHFRGQREVTLVLRGAQTGTSKELREHVRKHAKSVIPCTIREYTHREEHVREDIARSSVVLMPSQMEGFGLVGIEALAMGVPILVSQRSGLGELLLELVDADPALRFARRFVVDVGEGEKKDAERWAQAIREILTDREQAFRETAALREAIVKADYWRRAVEDLFGVLKIPPRDPGTPPDTPPDLAQRAQKILEIDPATAIVYSSSLLEREMERLVTSKEFAKSALPASQYLAILREKGILAPTEADLTKKVLHLRNMAAHKFDATFTKDMAEEHMRLVEALVEKLKSADSSHESPDPDENELLHGGSIEAARSVQTAAGDAHAEIDAACGRMNAGDLDVAIHILEDLRRKRWDGLTPRERYRVEANIGHALERKGEFRKAAQHYLEAKKHQPLDEKARSFEAIAYFHLDDKPKAYELAGEILKEHPNCSIAIAIRVRSSPPDVTLKELEAVVPPALSEELDILHALGWKALSVGDLAAANRFVEASLKRDPDSVEVKEQQAVVIVQEEGRAKHAGRPVNPTRVALAIDNLTAGLAKRRGHLDEARLRYNRAEAYDLLGKTEAAETDFRTAFDSDKEEPDVVRRFVLFLERHDRTDAAIETLVQADKVKKDHRNRLLLCGLLSDRKGKGDVEKAIAVLRETIAEEPEADIRTEMVALLTHLLGGLKESEQAIAFLDGLGQSFLQPAVMNAIRAKALIRSGRKEEARKCAIRATELLQSSSSVTDRMRVAESLSFVGEKQEALKQWKAILKPDHVDDFVCMALELARAVGDDTFIMSFCKQLRGAGAMSPFTLELEVVTLEKYRIFDRAIEVMSNYLVASPDGELAKVFRLRLSLLGIRLKKPELIESDPAKLPPVELSPVKIGAGAAHVLLNGPNPERGVEYAYELVRRNFDDHFARGAYVGIIGIGDDGYHFPDHPVVIPGSAVKYKADDTGEEQWLIVEDAADPKQERGEYPPSHVWAEELLGQSVNGKFHLRRDRLQPRTATIIGIVSKYVYRKFEIIDGWEERFPGEDKFFVRKYTFPTNPDGTPDISLILKALDDREKQKEEMHALYRANPISGTTFAMVSGSGLLESLSHIASEGSLPIRCCLGNDLELQRAEASLAGAEQFVLDPSALATLFFGRQWEQLQLLGGKIVLCESALDEYEELREKFSSPSRGFMGKFKGKYLFQEDDPAERQKQLDRLDTFLNRIRSLVALRTGEKLASLQTEQREELIRLFGQPTAEAMAEAATTGAVLWSDDLAVAEVGRERTGISKRVWSQLVFRQYAPHEVMTEFTLFLIAWRYFFTRLEPDVVIAACRDGSWNPDAPILKQVAEWLGQPELIHEGAIRMCILSLPLVWKHGPDVQQKQGVAKLLLQAIRLRKDGRRAISIIQSNLNAIFGGDKAACGECAPVIDEILQVERTPREIAASKAVWGKAAQSIQRKTGMSGAMGSHGIGQTHNQGGPKQHSKPKKGKRKRR
nr:glycosyltransferase [Gemmata massiliana]